jgi:6-phosphogluconolactonase
MTALVTRRFTTSAALEAALTERLAASIAAPSSPCPALMLAGGTTPLPAYRALGARAGLARNPSLRVLFTDDRYVPSDSPASNYHQLCPLLDALALPPEAVLRVETELPLEEAARASGAGIGLGVLGLGADGHTASLFRGADLERARGRLALAVQRPDGMSAVSVTPALIARVAEPVFVVSGSGKQESVRRLLAMTPDLIAWQAVAGCSRVELWMDEAAAG